MKRPKMLSLLVAAVAALTLAAAPVAASALTAQSNDIASGTWGTCPWEISEDGVLTVHPGTGEDTGYHSPWKSYEGSIVAIVFAEEGGARVIAPADSSGLCALYHYESDESGWDTVPVSNVFSIDLSGLDTSNVTNMYDMFYGCSSLSSLDVSGLDTSKVTDMGRMFSCCFSLEALDLSGFDTSNVTNMLAMFSFCSTLETLDLSSFDTSNVTSMSRMFADCSALKSLNVSGFDVSGLLETGMVGMFDGCLALESLDVSQWDTSNVIYMDNVFQDCSSLKSLDLSRWNTSSAVSMYSMFSGCSSLATLDVSGFDVSDVTNMGFMFTECPALSSLDLSSFDTSNVTRMDWMFSGSSSLETIYVSSLWSTESTEYFDGMFYGCYSLVGGNGTAYDEDNDDAEYAHADKPGAPGYLTDPKAEPEPTPVDSAWTRLAGDDRLGTMQAITKAGYSSADAVLVTTGWGDADALTAAGLSGILGAPILTTAPSELSSQAKSEIERLGAKEAIILGGTSAVSPKVESQLKAMGLKVSRLTGDNRIETALKIHEMGGDAWGGTCILSKGWVSADALAAGSFAYVNHAPIFLAMPDGTLTPETAAAVKGFDHVVVLGGTGGGAAVQDKTVEALGVSSWMRLAGDTRYDTAVQLAAWATGGDSKAAFQPEVKLRWQDAAVAFAWNYPDALVGVNVTGPKCSVTLLVSTDVDDFTKAVASALGEHADAISHGYVLGGEAVVSDAVKALFEAAAK